MNSQRCIAVLDEIGDVGPVMEGVAGQLGARCTTVQDYTALGRVLESKHFHALVVAAETMAPDDFKRLAVIHEELPWLGMVYMSRRGAADLLASGTIAADELLALVARAGVSDVVSYPAHPDSLCQALERSGALTAALRQWATTTKSEQARALGKVHAVTSARGGAGRTFFVINLAAHLARSQQNDVCIIDLDLPIGQAAAALGLRPRFTLVDALEAGDDLAEQLPSYCERHPAGFKLLAAPPVDDATRLTIDDALRVVAAAQRRFTHVVVDLPPATARMAFAVMRHATDRWCLATATIASLGTLTAVLAAMERVDEPLNELRIVLNHVGANSDVSAEDVDDTIPYGLTAALPWSKKLSMTSSIGRTVFDIEPHSELAMRLTALFNAYVDDGNPAACGSHKRYMIRNPFRRRS